MTLFSVKMFFFTLKYVNRNDVVLCVTSPFALPYFVTLAAKLRRSSAVLLIYDFYPEALVMAGLVQPKSLLVKALRFINGRLFRALDTIIIIGRDVEALLLKYNGLAKRTIKFIPNWTLLPIGYREVTTGNSFRRGLADKTVIGLSGNLGFTHDARTVYEAARLLKDEKHIHFLISGWGSGWKQLVQLYAKAPLGNVTMRGRVPDTELEEFLSAADVWIIPYRRNVAGVSVPSRIYNLLAVGRAIIVAAEPSSEAALILAEENIGWIVKPEDPRELAQAIRSAASDRNRNSGKGPARGSRCSTLYL